MGGRPTAPAAHGPGLAAAGGRRSDGGRIAGAAHPPASSQAVRAMVTVAPAQAHVVVRVGGKSTLANGDKSNINDGLEISATSGFIRGRGKMFD